MRFQWLKKLPLPALLVGGLVAGITGKVPGPGIPVTSHLDALDAWLNTYTDSPGLTLFFAGLLIAWLVYQVIVLWLFSRRKTARVKLALLRNDGVKIRIEGLHHIDTEDKVEPWVKKVEAWDKEVIAAIAKIDEADSLQHATLDYPGKARSDPPGGYRNQRHALFFVMHDVRLQRLYDRMSQYSLQVTP